MNPRLFRLSALSAALFSSYASAIGFGEINLLSRIGEPLRAEVPVMANASEQIETACFTLATLRGSDLPVVSAARIRVARNGPNYRLYITGTKPIAEPIFIIGLRANCGVDLQRDYVLMPPPPLMLAETDLPSAAPAASASVVSKKSGNFQEVRAREGETLESIAESHAPDSVVEQRRLLAALKRANPSLAGDQPLPEDTTVRIPNLRKQIAAEADTTAEPPPRPQRVASSEPPPRPKRVAPPPPRPAPPPVAKGPTDRVVLGAPPEEAKAGEKAVAPHATAGEMQERMLKLETTLTLLNQEVEKLNTALALTTEALAAQQKLQTAQSLQNAPEANAPAVKAAVPTTTAPDHSNQGNWLELLLSAVVGGGIAAGLAQLLSRRSSRSLDDEMPLAVNAYRHEVSPTAPPAAAPLATPVATPVPPAEPASASGPTQVDIPLDAHQSDFGKSHVVDVDFNDENSALELAEIMLSFGRVRGAAETLAMHIEENAPDNIQPWTMLLDLYRRGDMQEEFGSLSGRMRKKFNVQIPAWEDSTTPISGLKSLEDYAHVVWRVTNSWGTQDCLDYLFELVHDNRAGKRSGFPLEVVEEIALLMRVSEVAYGLKRPA